MSHDNSTLSEYHSVSATGSNWPDGAVGQLAFYQFMLMNISDWQFGFIQEYALEGQICMLDFWYSPPEHGNVYSYLLQ